MPPTPTSSCAPSSTSLRAAGCATRAPRRARAPRRSCSRSRASGGLRAMVAHRRALRAASSRSGLAKATGVPGRAGLHVGHRGRELRAGGRSRRTRRACRCWSSPPTGRPSCARSAPGRRSTRSSSTAARRSGSSRSTTTRRTPERLRWMRALACRALLDRARPAAPGPVHLNFPLREPLVPRRRRCRSEPGGGGRAGGRPWVTRPAPRAAPAPAAARRRSRTSSRRSRAAWSSPAARSAPAPRRRAGAFAEPPAARCSPTRSPARAAAPPRSPTTTRCCATAPWRRARARARHARRRPADLQAAAPVAARARDDARRSRSTPRAPGRTRPASSATVARPPTRARRSRRSPAAAARRRAADGWLDGWRAADRAAARRSPRRSAARRSASRASRPSSACGCPPRRRSSSPPRCPCATSRRSSRPRDAPPRVLANRGANGIDGTRLDRVRRGRRRAGPVVLLIGDVAFPHDIGGLLAARAPRPPADDRGARQRRRRDLRLPPGRGRSATTSRSTSPRRTGSTSRTRRRCTAAPTCGSPTPRRSAPRSTRALAAAA